MRIGILGAAKIAPIALIEPARAIPSCEIVGVAARDQSRAQAFADHHGIEKTYADYDALIAAPDIDLIYNPLMNHLHTEYSQKALKAGKHVLCEKPFAMNLGEAERVLAAAEQSGKRIIEAFHTCYHPGFQKLLEWVKEGRIGAPLSMEGEFSAFIPYEMAQNRHHRETGGGAMMDLGCYPLHWCQSVAATANIADEAWVKSAEATTNTHGVDETMSASLMFGQGVSAKISCSMAENADGDHARRTSFFEIIGGHGKISFNGAMWPYMNSHELPSSLILETPHGREDFPLSKLTTYTHQLDAVLSGLLNNSALPTEGQAILQQQKMLDEIYQKAGLGDLRKTSGSA